MRFAPLVWLAIGAGVVMAARAETRIVALHEATAISIALSPDHETLVIDLANRLWRLPANGGGAVPVTPENEAIRNPRFSPNGRNVVYQRLVDGQWDIWLLEFATSKQRALVSNTTDDRWPDFAADGRSVVFVSDCGGHACLWSVALDSGVRTQLTATAGDASYPTVSQFGDIAYVQNTAGIWSLNVLAADHSILTLTTSAHELAAPSWRPGGGVLVYNEYQASHSADLKLLVFADAPIIKPLTTGEDVYSSRVAWLSPAQYLYAADGHIWTRHIATNKREPVILIAAASVPVYKPPLIEIPLDAPGPHPAAGIASQSTSKNGKTRVFVALGDLWLGEAQGPSRQLTSDGYADIDPSVSPDGQFAVFASDRSGKMDLWRIDLKQGLLTQLTFGQDKIYRPAVSPDGHHVAFLSTPDLGPWNTASLRLLDLGSGIPARILASDLAAPTHPTWSDDGKSVSVKVGRPAEGIPEQKLVVDLLTGQALRLAISPSVSNTTTPDNGRMAAANRQAKSLKNGKRAATDCNRERDRSTKSGADPCRSGRSTTSLPSGATGDDAGTPTWQYATPNEPYVIQVGRLFDGLHGTYQQAVDIHIQGQRIVAITPRDLQPLPARVIDARDATVIPGLIDTQVRDTSLMGSRLGRIWLAYGVTTVREFTADVPASLERAESWASGRRPGPRVVIDAPTPGLRQTIQFGATPIISTPADGALGPVPLVYPPPFALRPNSEPAPRQTLATSVASPSAASGRPWIMASALPRLRISPAGRAYQDVTGSLAASGVPLISNLAATLGLSHDPALLPAFSRLYLPDERDRWENKRIDPDPALAATLESTLVQMIRSGVRVSIGSGAPAVPYGLGLHAEMALLAAAGIAPDQVLRMATAGNALALGLGQQLGTIEKGKLADLVILNGDPLHDISDTRNITAIVKSGIWFNREQLLAPSP